MAVAWKLALFVTQLLGTSPVAHIIATKYVTHGSTLNYIYIYMFIGIITKICL